MKKAVLLVSMLMMPLGLAIAGGEQTYQSYCIACHAAGVAGAPKLGDKAAWAPRIEMGVDALTATVISGKGAMPPKGACAACSDDDLRQAVQYMMDKSQ